MDLLGRFAYMLLLVAVGLGARRFGVLTGARNRRLSQLAFYIFLPALIFTSTNDRRLGAILSVELGAVTVATITILLALAWVVNLGGTDETRSVALVQSYHGNLGFFGLPVVATTLGSDAAATASVILGLGALVQTPLTVLVLVSITDADATLASELRSLATNPVLLTLGLALAFSTLGVSVPTAVDAGLGRLSTFALPTALVAVGGSLDVVTSDVPLGRIGRVVGLKTVVMPLVAWLLFSGLGVDPLTRNAGVVMFGAPTAVATYIYAAELGGDERFASVNVFATTVAAIGSLFVLLQFLT